MVLEFPEANGELVSLRGGVVIPAASYDETDPNAAFARWQAGVPVAGLNIAFRYTWSVTDKAAGEAVCEVRTLGFPPPPSCVGFRTYQPLRPAERIPFILDAFNSDPRYGSKCTKVDVPEWSNVLDRWPNVLYRPD